MGRLKKATDHIEKVITKTPLNDTRLSALNISLAIYISTSSWPNALSTAEYIRTSIKNISNFSTKTTEKSEQALLVLYNHIGEYDLAKQLANNLLTTVKSSRVRCIASSERLFSYVKTSPEDITSNDFDKALKLCRETGDIIIEQVVNGFLAEYFLVTGNPTQSLEVLTSNIDKVKSTKYQAAIAGFYQQMAKAYLAIGDYSNAEKHAQLLIDTEQQHQYKPTITNAYKVLAAVAEHNKKYDEALSYFKSYSEAKQLNLDQDNAKLLAIQKAEFDVVEKNTQIALLDKENALLKTQALLDSESAQNRRLALALLSMALVVFVLWTYKNRRNYLRMQHYAQVDELTGIANRHYFTQQANTAIKYCQRTDQPVSFIMFDLDFFKRINDAYGHQTGDMALKIAVDAAKLACRKNDIIGRLGGEEFGVLLPGCASHLATFIAEKCRKAIEQADFTESGHDLTVTASFGISDSSACEYNFEKLFAGADFALYQSKDMGRNRVVQYQQEAIAFDI